MTLSFECPACQSSNRLELCPKPAAIVCPDCSHPTPARPDAVDGARLLRCVLCGTEDLYVQKDFPHRLGLTILGLGIVLSSIAWGLRHSVLAWGILFLTAALDACLYYLVGDATVCYRCLAQYRGNERNPAHAPFELAIGERYRQERLRLEMLRGKAGAESGGSP